MCDASSKLTNRLHFLRLAKLPFQCPLLGYVLLDGYEVRDASTVIGYGCDGHLLSVGGGVLAPIDHLAAPDMPLLEGVPHGLIERLRMDSGLEDSSILTECFISRAGPAGSMNSIHYAECHGRRSG